MASFDPDFELALKLQAEFNNEDNYRKKIERKVNAAQLVPRPVTNSLVDSIWETIDPTPDIHTLFLAFNKRFFWGTLNSVEVCWSSRLKSSAGVCSYHVRSGYCSVRLSAPLLKLRPRSDLVETLLHELIHAYLFVNNNDRDRDGHGPMFQSHMQRINKEAGTNITIYHNFHNEVKLYQQHWWRCDGPCQSRRPFFGFVKRSMNRAPGPNDLWWTEHQATCGGHFIKIKEPDGFIKNKKLSSQSTKTSNNKITGFFKSTDSPLSKNKVESKSTKSTNKNITGFFKPTGSPLSINKVENKSTKTSNKNITGFFRPTGSPSSIDKVQNKSKEQRNVKEVIKGYKTNVIPFSGNGYVLGNKPAEKPSSNNSLAFPRKRTLEKSEFKSNISKSKQPKLDAKVFNTEDNCPICNVKVSKTEMSSHLNNCVDLTEQIDDSPTDEICKCPVCNINTSRNDMNSHIENCTGLSNIFNDSAVLELSDDEETVGEDKVLCPCCNKKIEDEINKHLDECLNMSLLAEIV